jgi:hypothetical protein
MGGNEPNNVGGKPNGTALGAKPFADRTEQTEAMKDSRYGRDPDYTNAVIARVAVSEFT